MDYTIRLATPLPPPSREEIEDATALARGLEPLVRAWEKAVEALFEQDAFESEGGH